MWRVDTRRGRGCGSARDRDRRRVRVPGRSPSLSCRSDGGWPTAATPGSRDSRHRSGTGPGTRQRTRGSAYRRKGVRSRASNYRSAATPVKWRAQTVFIRRGYRASVASRPRPRCRRVPQTSLLPPVPPQPYRRPCRRQVMLDASDALVGHRLIAGAPSVGTGARGRLTQVVPGPCELWHQLPVALGCLRDPGSCEDRC
jgi:hypothetical protein